MHNDPLGQRMKEQYELRYKISLPRRTYTIIRIDGKAFHTYTCGCRRPFDDSITFCMDRTAEFLCDNIQGCAFGYTQSDEISLLLTDFAKRHTAAWFDGNVQKIASVSASMATMRFNEMVETLNIEVSGQPAPTITISGNALFDSRVFIIPDPEEVVNYFIWRQKDAIRNSISAAAQHYYPHADLQGKDKNLQLQLLLNKGVKWDDYPTRFRYGGLVIPSTERRGWTVNKETPLFTHGRMDVLPVPTHGYE